VVHHRGDPILVTGAHRSGTTWVGTVLASAPAVTYIHEPFHIHHDPAVCAARFDDWFSYVCDENEETYYEPVSDMLARTSGRALIKDPIAVFSAGWLSSRFGMRPVVLIRHPAAFAASLKTARWTHPFKHFLRQPLLMAHRLEPFAEQIMRFAHTEHDIIDQAALLWTLIYTAVLDYQQRVPQWLYVRHEDLARDPVAGFRGLFETLDLEFCEATERVIQQRRRHDLNRWGAVLTPADVDRVRAAVHAVSARFYGDEEWQPA
jgi:hypothetical protein